jgi:hypothetical protein
VLKPGARKILEQNAREVRLAAHTGSTKGRPVWIGFQPSNEFLQVVRRQSFLCGEDIIENLMQGDRLEIAQYVIWKHVDGSVCDMRAPVSRAERVAIGSGAEDPTGADVAARTPHVLNNDGLTKEGPHALGQDAQDHICSASCSKRHDQGDGARRIGLRPRDARKRRQRRSAGGQMQKLPSVEKFHGVLLGPPGWRNARSWLAG